MNSHFRLHFVSSVHMALKKIHMHLSKTMSCHPNGLNNDLIAPHFTWQQCFCMRLNCTIFQVTITHAWEEHNSSKLSFLPFFMTMYMTVYKRCVTRINDCGITPPGGRTVIIFLRVWKELSQDPNESIFYFSTSSIKSFCVKCSK